MVMYIQCEHCGNHYNTCVLCGKMIKRTDKATRIQVDTYRGVSTTQSVEVHEKCYEEKISPLLGTE